MPPSLQFLVLPRLRDTAGYIGTEEQWAKVVSEWAENLRMWGLDDFHLTDLPHKLGHSNAELCVKTFANIIEPSGLRHLDASLVDADWERLERDDEQRKRFPHRYHACLYMLFDVLEDEIRLEFKGQQIAIVLDDDIQPQDAAQAIFNEYKERQSAGFAALAFTNRRKCLPLQCADLIVGSFRQAWLHSVETGTEAGFSAAMRNRVIFHGRGSHWSAETMKVAEEMRTKPRLL